MLFFSQSDSFFLLENWIIRIDLENTTLKLDKAGHLKAETQFLSSSSVYVSDSETGFLFLYIYIFKIYSTINHRVNIMFVTHSVLVLFSFTIVWNVCL